LSACKCQCASETGLTAVQQSRRIRVCQRCHIRSSTRGGGVRIRGGGQCSDIWSRASDSDTALILRRITHVIGVAVCASCLCKACVLKPSTAHTWACHPASRHHTPGWTGAVRTCGGHAGASRAEASTLATGIGQRPHPTTGARVHQRSLVRVRSGPDTPRA
jgi:hypothetical protein